MKCPFIRPRRREDNIKMDLSSGCCPVSVFVGSSLSTFSSPSPSIFEEVVLFLHL